MIVPPGRSAPEASAASHHAQRDPVLHRPAGIEVLHLGQHGRGARPPWPSALVTARSLSSGVLPTSSISDSWTCISHPSW